MQIIDTETHYPTITVITVRDDNGEKKSYQFYNVNGTVDISLWTDVDGTLVWWYEDQITIDREGFGILKNKYAAIDFYYDWLNYRHSDRYQDDYVCGLI